MIPNKKLTWNDVKWLSANDVIESKTKQLVEERAAMGWVGSAGDSWDGVYTMGTGFSKKPVRTSTSTSTSAKPFRYGKSGYSEAEH